MGTSAPRRDDDLRRTLAAAVDTAMRSPRHARSGLAAILATYAALAPADIAAAYAVGADRVQLLAAAGPRADVLGRPGPVHGASAPAIRDRAACSGVVPASLPGEWSGHGVVSWASGRLSDDHCLVVLVAGGDQPAISIEELLGPVSTFGAVVVATELATTASGRLARVQQEHAMAVAGLQHDLRAPLQAVLSAAITLRERGDLLDDATRERLLDMVVEQAQRTAVLASTGLSDNADRAPVRRMVVDLAALLRRVAEAGRTVRGGAVVLDVPAQVRTVTDPVRLERAVTNLLDNALKYGGHAGPVHVTVERADGHLTLTVADQGPGVSDHVLPSLFGAYVSDPAEAGGTGMGLHSVRRIVQELGGGVTYSRLDGWTRFCLTLPDLEREPMVAPDGDVVGQLV